MPLDARFAILVRSLTGKPEVIGSSVVLVPTNALVLTCLANFRVVGNPEVRMSQLGKFQVARHSAWLPK
jgi:hypothetical protein